MNRAPTDPLSNTSLCRLKPEAFPLDTTTALATEQIIAPRYIPKTSLQFPSGVIEGFLQQTARHPISSAGVAHFPVQSKTRSTPKVSVSKTLHNFGGWGKSALDFPHSPRPAWAPKVSQAAIVPEFRPLRNHSSRWALEPCVQFSGLDARPLILCRWSSPTAAAALSAPAISSAWTKPRCSVV